MRTQCYSTDGNQAATADDTIISIESATTIRPRLYYVTIGSGATPASQGYNMQVRRFTASGTNTAVTCQPLDPVDVASKATGGENHSAEPTYTAGSIMLSFAWQLTYMNPFVWEAPEGGEIVSPATANNGVGLTFVVVSGGTEVCEAQFLHTE